MRRFMNPYTLGFLGLMVFMNMRNNHFTNVMDWLMDKIYILPAIVIGLSFHEFAHAFVAAKLGDDTPRLQGRVTLNPASHIDPIGLLALFFAGFGWGVPVEINPRNFKKPRRDELLVSLAGVSMNLLLAVVFAMIIKILVSFGGGIFSGSMMYSVYMILWNIVVINLVLMVFNLLPVPPLDGFGILTEIFNLKKYDWWYPVYERGNFILILLIITSATSKIIVPVVGIFMELLGLA